MRAREFVLETTSGDMAVVIRPMGIITRSGNAARSNKYGVGYQLPKSEEKHVSRRFKNSFGH